MADPGAYPTTHHADIPATGMVEWPVERLKKSDLNHGDDVLLKTRKQVLNNVQAAYRAAIKVPFSIDEFLVERAADAARET